MKKLFDTEVISRFLTMSFVDEFGSGSTTPSDSESLVRVALGTRLNMLSAEAVDAALQDHGINMEAEYMIMFYHIIKSEIEHRNIDGSTIRRVECDSCDDNDDKTWITFVLLCAHDRTANLLIPATVAKRMMRKAREITI